MAAWEQGWGWKASPGVARPCHSSLKLPPCQRSGPWFNSYPMTTHSHAPLPFIWAPSLLSRARAAKGARCFLEQNAVYAEQVEINLHQLFQRMAGGLLMATSQPFRGEMIYCRRDACHLARNLGPSHLPRASTTQHLLGSGTLYQPLTFFPIPGFVISHDMQLQPSLFWFDIGREGAGAPGSLGSFCEENLFSLNPAHSLISK